MQDRVNSSTAVRCPWLTSRISYLHPCRGLRSTLSEPDTEGAEQKTKLLQHGWQSSPDGYPAVDALADRSVWSDALWTMPFSWSIVVQLSSCVDNQVQLSSCVDDQVQLSSFADVQVQLYHYLKLPPTYATLSEKAAIFASVMRVSPVAINASLSKL